MKHFAVLLVLAFVFTGCTEVPPVDYKIDFMDTTGKFSQDLTLEPKVIEGSLVTFHIPCADVFDYQFTLTQKKGRFWGVNSTGVFAFRVPQATCPEQKDFPVTLDLVDLSRRLSEKFQISPFNEITVNGKEIEFPKQ